MKDPETLKSLLVSMSSIKPTGLSVHETLPEFPEILEQETVSKPLKTNSKVLIFWSGWAICLIFLLYLIKRFS